MTWESHLGGLKEVPGSSKPVVSRYPARFTSAGPFIVSALLLTIA